MEQSETKHTPLAGAVVLGVVVILLTAYLVGGAMLHIAPLYSGLFFAVYWGNIRKADLREWLPAVVGGVGGLLLAWGLVLGKVHYGTSGLVVMLGLIIIALYFDIIKFMAVLFNASFMVYLTLGGIPAVVAQGDFPMMIVALLASAAFFGGFVFMLERLQKSR